MKNVIYFLLLCLPLTFLHGQGWERHYALEPHDTVAPYIFFLSNGGELIPTPDGGFLLNSKVESNPPPFDTVTEHYYMYKLAADGSQQWKKTHAAFLGARVVAMWPAEDNHLLFVTLRNDTTRLVKTDANFQPIWTRTLDAPGEEGKTLRVRAVNGGYVVVYQLPGQQIRPVRVFKTDLNGSLLWQNDFNNTNNGFLYHDFVADSAGNIFLFGAGARLIKVAPTGAELFTITYAATTYILSPILLNDDLLAFKTDDYRVLLINGSGNLLKTINTNPEKFLERIAAAGDGNILLGYGGNELEKITPQNVSIWTRKFGEGNFLPFVIWPLADGGTAILFAYDDYSGSNGLAHAVVRTDANGLVYTNQVHGHIFADVDKDCADSPGTDFPAPAINLIAQKGNQFYYSTTDSLGDYSFSLDTGTHVLRIKPPSGAWQSCTDSLVLTLAAYDTLAWNVGIQSELPCPWPWVGLNAPFLRRCFPSTYQVTYGNSSTITADSAVVKLMLDPFLSLQTASLPYTSLGNNAYEFFVGDLHALQTGSFQVQVFVDCDAPPGQTHCSSAELRVANPCPPDSLQMPVIQVEAACEGDSVSFLIRNAGTPMTEEAEFVIIEDLIVMRQGPFQLPSHGETVIKCPTNGKTSRIYAGQAPGEPPFLATTTAIEGCNGPIQSGVWNMFPAVSARQNYDLDCQPNISSFDPNDKQAVPTGYDTEHYIGRKVPLDYKIRFQNTGTDTAFLVVIRDTLSPWLDAASLRPGPSSHPYTWQMLGNGVAQFTFANILLPDSTTNLAASQGFVSFHIDQQPDVPLQTLIENQAAIFFDFNAAVLTNTTFHRVGENFVTLLDAWEPGQKGAQVQASPNPFNTETRLEVQGVTGPLRLQLFDFQGKMVRAMQSENEIFELKKGALPPGIYLFHIDQNGLPVGRGKLLIQ